MTTALAVHTPDGGAIMPQPPRLGLLRPLAQPADILQSQEETRRLITETLQDGRDYGLIPGIDKPSLFKPGAERIGLSFGCTPRFRVVEQEVDHDRLVPWRKVRAIWEGPKGNRRKTGEEVQTGESLGLYRYVVECEIVHRESGQVVGSCVGVCSTMESKYIDRPRDCENTVVKMAQKRAHVGATLLAFGLSEQFTQDVEDLPRDASAGTSTQDDDLVKCPKCQGPMWDNRDKNDEREKEGKKRMPDYKCKAKHCEHVIWEAQQHADELAAREGEQRPDPTASTAPQTSSDSSRPAGAGSSGSTAPRGSAPNADEMTLERALALPLMGRPDSWGNYGTKPLSTCPDKVLKQARHFFRDKVAEQANPRMEEQLAAIAMVLEDREKTPPAQAPHSVAGAPAPTAHAAPETVDATVSWLDDRLAALKTALADPQLAPKVKAEVEGQFTRGELTTVLAVESALVTVERNILPF